MASVGARISVLRCCATIDSGDTAWPSFWFSLRNIKQLNRDRIVKAINQARGDMLQASADPKDPRGVLLSSEFVTHQQIPDVLCAIIKGVDWRQKHNGIYAIKRFHGDSSTLGVWLWCSLPDRFVIRAAINIDLDLLCKAISAHDGLVTAKRQRGWEGNVRLYNVHVATDGSCSPARLAAIVDEAVSLQLQQTR